MMAAAAQDAEAALSSSGMHKRAAEGLKYLRVLQQTLDALTEMQDKPLCMLRSSSSW